MNTVVAAQMYTLRDFTKTPEDIDETFRRVKAIGYDAVQMSAWGPIAPKDLKVLADKHELVICATHMKFDRIVDDIDAVIDEHHIWDCRYVGLGSMPQKYQRSREGVMEFIGKIQPSAKKIRDAGLHFIYHNHDFEFYKVGGKTIMDVLMEETDPDWFQFEIDTCWVQAGGGDPAQWIEKMVGRMDVVHFKDMEIIYEGESTKQTMCEVGEGNINMMACVAACAKGNVKWHVVEQDICRRDPFESLSISLGNLHRMGLR